MGEVTIVTEREEQSKRMIIDMPLIIFILFDTSSVLESEFKDRFTALEKSTKASRIFKLKSLEFILRYLIKKPSNTSIFFCLRA